jgi:hypothetical protein
VRDGIAHLRAAWAAHPEDQALTELIAEFITRDEEFARLWAERDVKVNGRGHKVMRHPDAEDDLIDARTRLQEHTNKTK